MSGHFVEPESGFGSVEDIYAQGDKLKIGSTYSILQYRVLLVKKTFQSHGNCKCRTKTTTHKNTNKAIEIFD